MNKSILELSNYVNLIVSVVLEQDGKILMVEEAKKGLGGLLNFPSGKVKQGETLIEAIEREALEETGYKIEVSDLCSVYHYEWDDKNGISIRFNFWGKIIKKETEELAKDVKSINFYDKDELKAIVREKRYRFGGTALMIMDVLARKKASLDMIVSTNGSIEEILDENI